MTPPPPSLPRFPLRLPRRARGEELIDRPDVDPEMLLRSLREVSRVNVRLGGIRSLRWGMSSLSEGSSELSLLDVGVGNAEVPRRLARELARRGVRLRWTGLDLSPVALGVARDELGDSGSRSPLILGDGRFLPFSRGSFDVVAATLTLHHLGDRECVDVLEEMGRVARKAVLVSDLERHPLHYLGARLLASTCWRGDPLTRHDGPLSVLRGFTRDELRQLAAQAGLRGTGVRRFLPFRLLLRARPGPWNGPEAP